MGVGYFPAGVGMAGIIPPPTPSNPDGQPYPPRALRFDPTIRGFVTNADGTIDDVHPVDQQVALALFFQAGPGPSDSPATSAFKASIPSSPGTGNRLRARLNRSDPARAQSISEDEVRVRLADLLANNDILLLSVSGDGAPHGRNYVSVEYVNLRLPGIDPTNPQLSRTFLAGTLAG